MVFSEMKILLMNLMIILRDVRSIEIWINVIIISIMHVSKKVYLKEYEIMHIKCFFLK